VVGDGENEDVIQIVDVIVERIRESSETDTAISIAEDRPPIWLSCDPFNGLLDCCLELGPKPCPAPLVPSSGVPILLGSQPMKEDVHARPLGRLSLVSEIRPGHRRRGIVPEFLQSTVQLGGQLVVKKLSVFGRQRLEQFLGDEGAVALG